MYNEAKSELADIEAENTRETEAMLGNDVIVYNNDVIDMIQNRSEIYKNHYN